MRRAALLATAALAAVACTPRPSRPPGAGRRTAEGVAVALRPSPDGTRLAWLARCARPPVAGLPREALACDLLVAPAAGGEPRRIAGGVSSLEGSFAWGADGSLAALADHDPAAGSGSLVVARPGGEPRTLAPAVSFWGFGPGGALGLVAAGELRVALPGGEPLPVRGATGIATFEFHPRDATRLLARRRGAAGGELLHVAGGTAQVLGGSAAGDYAWSPDGSFVAATVRGAAGAWDLRLWRAGRAGPGAVLGAAVQGFAFSRDGGALAFLAGVAPGRSGDLLLASLAGVEDEGRVKAAPVARGVGDFRWAAAARRISWLEGFDARIRAGTLGAGGQGMPAVTFGRNVTAYDLSPSGEQVAFLEHVTAGGYSVDLKLSPAGAAAAGTVARGVFGFEFSPDGRWLYYRAGCIRNAEACDLWRLPATGLAPGQSPERIADGVKGFEFDRARPGRLLLSFSRTDLAALDLAVWDEGKVRPLGAAALPGSAAFLPPDGRRVAWIGVAPGDAGVFVADGP